MAYCFVTYNTGTITLTHHSANDTQIGVLLNNTVFTLGPGAGVFFTVTREISVTVVNTATWIASNPGPTDQATDTDSAKVAVLSFLYLPSLLK